MPIYEYFCNDCNVVFSFMSSQVGPTEIPVCPRCSSEAMIKHLSSFASPSNTSAVTDTIDEEKVERGFSNLLQKVENLSVQNASDVGSLMESFTQECGYEFSGSMKSLISENSAGISSEDISPKELLVKAAGQSVSIDEREKRKGIPEIDPKIYQL